MDIDPTSSTPTPPPVIKRPIKTNRAGTAKTVWLVKIPAEVAELWEHAQDNDNLGNFTISKTNQNQMNINIKTSKPNDFLRYNVVKQDHDLTNLQFFQGNFHEVLPEAEPKPSPIYWEGRITAKAILQAELNDKYREMCKARVFQNRRKQRTVISFESEDDMNIQKPSKKLVKDQAKKDKRERMPEDQLEKVLFQLFDKKPLWNISELESETDQPKNHLQKILQKICDYNKTGDKKGCFELKFPKY